jgi:hypothetical protein
MRKTPNRPDAVAEHHRRFIETARELECGEDKERVAEK